MIFFSLLFISGPLLFVNFTKFFHDVTSKSGLSCIDVSDKDDIDVLLFKLINFDIFIFWPLGSHKSLNVDLWVTFSDDDFLFLLDRSLFDLGLFFLLRLISFFFLFVEFKIIAWLFFLKIVHLNIIEFLSKFISVFTVLIHSFIEDIHVHDLSGEDIAIDIRLEIIKIGQISVDLFGLPLFVDCLSQCSNELEEVLEKVIIFRNHCPLEIAELIWILHPDVDWLGLFDFFSLNKKEKYVFVSSLILIVCVLGFHQQLILFDFYPYIYQIISTLFILSISILIHKFLKNWI